MEGSFAYIDINYSIQSLNRQYSDSNPIALSSSDLGWTLNTTSGDIFLMVNGYDMTAPRNLLSALNQKILLKMSYSVVDESLISIRIGSVYGN